MFNGTYLCLRRKILIFFPRLINISRYLLDHGQHEDCCISGAQDQLSTRKQDEMITNVNK